MELCANDSHMSTIGIITKRGWAYLSVPMVTLSFLAALGVGQAAHGPKCPYPAQTSQSRSASTGALHGGCFVEDRSSFEVAHYTGSGVAVNEETFRGRKSNDTDLDDRRGPLLPLWLRPWVIRQFLLAGPGLAGRSDKRPEPYPHGPQAPVMPSGTREPAAKLLGFAAFGSPVPQHHSVRLETLLASQQRMGRPKSVAYLVSFFYWGQDNSCQSYCNTSCPQSTGGSC